MPSVGSAIVAIYMETAIFAIVCNCLRSAIYDRLRSYGNQPLLCKRLAHLRMVQEKIVPSNTKIFWLQNKDIMTMREKEILAWVVGIQKENQG